MVETPEIRLASSADLEQARALLSANALPLDGFATTLGPAWVALDRQMIVGVVALETYADGALLRSLAVRSDMRGQRLGHRLVTVALDDARRRDVRAVYLLTTTAETFFLGLGFVTVARNDVPPSVLDSVEFQSACPTTATVMTLRLD